MKISEKLKEKTRHILIDSYWRKFFKEEDEDDVFSFIYNFYVNDLLSYGICLGFSEDICRDAVHDVFCKLLIDKKKFTAVKNLTAYLFTTLRNHLFNIQKKNYNLSNFNSENVSFTTDITVLDSLINEEDTERLKRTVENLLNELTPRQREAIYLRYMQEMEYEEVASLMKIDYNSARRLVYRSIKHLKSMYNDLEKPFLVSLIVLTYPCNL